MAYSGPLYFVWFRRASLAGLVATWPRDRAERALLCPFLETLIVGGLVYDRSITIELQHAYTYSVSLDHFTSLFYSVQRRGDSPRLVAAVLCPSS